MTDTHEAVRLADWLQATVNMYPQMSEDEPGGYATEFDQKVDEAAALLSRIPELEAEVQEQARLNGMGAERELALRARIEELETDFRLLMDDRNSLHFKARASANLVEEIEAERDRLSAIAEGREAGCQCGDDDVCKIVKERDRLSAELASVLNKHTVEFMHSATQGSEE